MNKQGLINITLLGIMILFKSNSLVYAANYSITNLVDTNGIFKQLSVPSLNDNSVVAFKASLDDDSQGVFTSANPDVSITESLDGIYNFSNIPSINNNGTVVFVVNFTSGISAIYTSDNLIAPIADTSGIFSDFSAVTINNLGTIAFWSYLDAGGRGVFTSKDLGVPVVDTSGQFSAFGTVAINDSDTLAFTGIYDAGGEGIYLSSDLTTPVVTNDEIRLSLGGPIMNNNEMIAFNAYLTSGDLAIFTSDDLDTPFVDTSGDFFNLGPFSINDVGQIVFMGIHSDGKAGIYTGLDLVNDKVIETGDLLDGARVTNVGFDGYTGINNKGEVALWVELDSGIIGIYLASPVESIPVYTCYGDSFEKPFDENITIKKQVKRVIPISMMLVDSNDYVVKDSDLSSPPVINVTFSPDIDPDYINNIRLLSPNLADSGNEFYFEDPYWEYYLATRKYSSPGTYAVTAVEGDDSYQIDQNSCVGSFLRQP